MKKISIIAALLVCLGFCGASNALPIVDPASMAVTDFGSSEAGGVMNSTVMVGNEMRGWEFTPTRNIVVESLGLYGTCQ